MKSGGQKGNQNARGGRAYRSLDEKERSARVEADAMLNLAVPRAVATLIAILEDPTSTKFDRQHAADSILDRKIPKVTSAEIALKDAPAILLRIPGLNWPAEIPALEERALLAGANGNGEVVGA